MTRSATSRTTGRTAGTSCGSSRTRTPARSSATRTSSSSATGSSRRCGRSEPALRDPLLLRGLREVLLELLQRVGVAFLEVAADRLRLLVRAVAEHLHRD